MISHWLGWVDAIEGKTDRWLTYALLALAVVLVLVAILPARLTWLKAAALAWAVLP